jgi:hypothetical protein
LRWEKGQAAGIQVKKRQERRSNRIVHLDPLPTLEKAATAAITRRELQFENFVSYEEVRLWSEG